MASAPNSRASASSVPATRARARSELLAQLRAAAERGVSLAPPPGSDATVRGWLEAASVALDNARNPTLGATRLAAFRARFPSHPALAALAGEPGIGIEEPAASLDAAPHVALMLPLTGRTSAPAAQIRDGFMTAYYQLPAATRPRLRVYDTAVTSIADTIAQAHRRRRRIHRRPADARRSRRRGRAADYPAADPGAQFPAGGPADAGTLLPVRAFAGR